MKSSNTNKFLLAASRILLVFVAISLQFCSNHEERMHVEKFGEENKLIVVPWKDNNDNLQVTIDGYSSENYKINIDIYYLDQPTGKDKKTQSESIAIPAGKVKATFIRDYYGAKGVGKVEVRLEGPDAVRCEIDVTLGIR